MLKLGVTHICLHFFFANFISVKFVVYFITIINIYKLYSIFRKHIPHINAQKNMKLTYFSSIQNKYNSIYKCMCNFLSTSIHGYTEQLWKR